MADVALAGLFGHLRNQVSHHNSQVVDVKYSVHIRIFSVKGSLCLVETKGELQVAGDNETVIVLETRDLGDFNVDITSR